MNTNAVNEFTSYIEKQILSSVSDIKSLEDKSRKHVQKLVYTNLVDRFDVMIDRSILDNARSDFIIDTITPSMNESVSESYLLRLLMNTDTVQDAIDDRLQSAVRNTVLRKRHSQKLEFLLKLFDKLEYTRAKPQVQPGSGSIVASAKKTSVNVPHSVCGYSDWLYARRNAIVHGAGRSSFLSNDKKQLKKLYSYNCPQRFRIAIGAITSSVNFYRGVADIIEGRA